MNSEPVAPVVASPPVETAAVAAPSTTDPAPSTEARKLPGATRVVTLNTKRGPVSFETRAKSETGAAPFVEAPSGSPAQATGAASETAATAPPKPTEPAPHRALTKALELEARLVEERRAFKAEQDAHKAQQAALDADVKLISQARDLVKRGQRLKAMELLGIDLDGAQDEFLASAIEETPEAKVQRLVDERLAKDRETAAAEVKAREEAAQKQRSDADNARVDAWKTAAEATYAEKVAEFDEAAFDGVTADAIWQRAVKEFNATGKLPTGYESLQLIQKDFDARLAKSKRYRPAEAAPPATTEAAKDKPSVKAKDTTPKTLTSRGAGNVPIRSKTGGAKTAHERAREAALEIGVVID